MMIFSNIAAISRRTTSYQQLAFFFNKMMIRKQTGIHILIVFLLSISIQFLYGAPRNNQPVDKVHISLELKNESLVTAFRKIEAQSPFSFMYRQDEVKDIINLNIPASRQSVAAFLTVLLAKTNLSYRQVENRILIIPSKKLYPEVKADVLNHSSYSANAIISGQITNAKRERLSGVSITVKGSNTGTTSDDQGNYSINTPDNGILVFSFVGYATTEVSVGNRTTVNVILSENNTTLDDVVVTALGIRKEAKRLGYSTGTVNTEQITTNRTANVGSSLQGKVSGLNVSTPASGPGGSAKIRIRGQSSFGSDNSPLIVVNGIPVNNTSIPAGARNPQSPTGGSSDGGDGLQSINQDDIESITILKGAAAAALYGFRAKDGAIIITTKSGAKSSGIGVEYNVNFQSEQALDYTDFQYEYGQGRNGIRPLTLADAKSTGTWSFGEKLDGKPTFQFDGTMQPYLPYDDRIKKFYRTGTNFTNSIAISGGNEKGNFRISFANTDANAIVPNSDYHKKILNFGLSYKLTSRLSAQINANYSNEYNKNPPQIGVQNFSVNTTIYTMSNSINSDWLQNRKDSLGNEMSISSFVRNNPYWVAYDRFENVRRDRIFGNTSVRYQLKDWLYVQGRIGQDYYTRPYDYNIPSGSFGERSLTTGFAGTYYQDITTFRERNLDFLVGGNHSFGKFGIDITLGGNQMQQIFDNLGTSVRDFYVRDLYTVGNGQTKTPFYSYRKKKVNSLYGSAELSYSNYLFMTVTGRNDWFSTLNPESNNYLYPSVSTSFLFSEAFGFMPAWLNYGKLRASYAEVGGDTEPYANNLYYSINANPFNGIALGTVASSVSPNANLRPLKVKEAEIGLELKTLDSRVNLDFTLYRKNSVDEILDVDISLASGSSQTKVNIGKLRNQGVEALLTLIPVKSGDIVWETVFNTAYNSSEVLELANDQKVFDVSAGQHIGFVSHEVGQPLGSLRGFDYKRDAKGRIITSAGKPIQGDLTNFGSAIPQWTGGWLNTVTIMGFRIFTQVDFKQGGKILSNSNYNFLRGGLAKESLVGREGGFVFDGVNADGSSNTTVVQAEDFYGNYSNTSIATPFIYDASFIRWRSLSVGYDLSRLVSKSFIKQMNISAIVNNVWLIKRHIANLDPEAQVSVSDNFQGMENHVLPTTRSYGINLSVKL